MVIGGIAVIAHKMRALLQKQPQDLVTPHRAGSLPKTSGPTQPTNSTLR
jgi:hypothetical protein